MTIQREVPVWIPVSGIDLALPGDLTSCEADTGLVIFAHGSGSSRLSPRNRAVDAALAQAGLAPLLFDLLTASEATDRANVFEIPLLAARVADAVDWPPRRAAACGPCTRPLRSLDRGGGSAGGVGAVVSRRGRPDLASTALERVAAPTLLIVGGADDVVIDLDRAAHARLRCEKRLEIAPGATHLFEEPETLEAVMGLAAGWFDAHLAGRP